MTPRVRVNQLGYLATGPLRATLVTDATRPVPWRLERAGALVAQGGSTPRGHDPSAGLDVHVLDVPTPAPGTGYRLAADGDTSDEFAVGDDLYAGLADDALRFFHLQRSGVEIGPDVAGPAYARPAGHRGAHPNRGDTAVPCLPAGHAVTPDGVDLYEGWTDSHVLDVSGGWYDAGDQGKYVVNGGIAVAQLLAVAERLARRGRADSPFARRVRAEARWELEWLLRMQVPAGHRHAGMAHHKVVDERWTPLPTLPHLDPQPRYLHRPSTAATLNLAAAAAQGARVLATDDPDLAQRLLAAARVAYAAALETPDLLAPDTNALADAGGGPYDDTDVDDERGWAAAELLLTTGEAAYAEDLRGNPWFVGGTRDPWAVLDWQWTGALPLMQLALAPGVPALPEQDAVRAAVAQAADRWLAAQRAQPFGHPYAPPDGRYAWGSNGRLLTNLTVLAAAYDVTRDPRYRDGVAEGIDYLLGRNALGLSYVTGYGTRYAAHQHSRWYAHQLDPRLPPPPPGTVAGGPNSDVPDPVAAPLSGRAAQLCYVDDIGSYGTNELTINWNAPLVQVAAFLVDPG
ncbi:glycoside hydrolase family 9 protein [Cellulomonas alba]|uniref:Endoglucanase n=1 Tax=Cellulomonas alba TaxID=3053467 RepID=A0ABT7SIQ0_9CELL|nr:glycoside hydrolase family 9 protein [Cellulomonas alba]MDM7856050.1 glycoside hydrolase family 9 protein [Cellulomonas alba]